MNIGDKVRVKQCPQKELVVAKIIRGQYGPAARCVDKDGNYVGQFYVATLDKVS